MRLGQLARRLELRPAQIVEFLALKGIQIDDSVNTRLEDDHVRIAISHFSPDYEEVLSEIAEKKDPEVLEIEAQADTPPVTTELKIEDNTDGEHAAAEATPEVIKAPKVALAGLKVLGKIDLPEPKKKEETQELQGEIPRQDASEPKQQRQVRNIGRKDQRHDQRERKNPIALKREREALEEQKKREEQAEREKERRTRNYQKRVKMSPPTKAVRMVEEPIMQMSAEELEEAPKTWLGRLFKWFTTA